MHENIFKLSYCGEKRQAESAARNILAAAFPEAKIKYGENAWGDALLHAKVGRASVSLSCMRLCGTAAGHQWGFFVTIRSLSEERTCELEMAVQNAARSWRQARKDYRGLWNGAEFRQATAGAAQPLKAKL